MRILPIILFSLFVFTESSGMELSIDDAVDYAVKNNLELKAKREEINIAKVELKSKESERTKMMGLLLSF